MEFYRFLPFLHDDLQNIVRGVDRTTVGLHESSDKICKIAVACQVVVSVVTGEYCIAGQPRLLSSNLHTRSCGGKLYGAQLVLGFAS